MMEQTHAGECHYHTVSVTGLDNEIVTDRAARLCYVGNTASLCSLNIVSKREERIRANGNACDRIEILSCLTVGKRLGTGGKILLPVALCTNVLLVLIDISVSNIISVGTGNCGKERKGENLFMLAEMPGISLGSCETGAVNSRLLTCPNAYSLSLICIANGI